MNNLQTEQYLLYNNLYQQEVPPIDDVPTQLYLQVDQLLKVLANAIPGEVTPERRRAFMEANTNVKRLMTEALTPTYVIRFRNRDESWTPWFNMGGGIVTADVEVKLVGSVDKPANTVDNQPQ